MTQQTLTSSPPNHFLYEKPGWKLLFNGAGVVTAAALLIVTLIIGATINKSAVLFNPRNIASIGQQWYAYALMAPATVLILTAGGIDLSMGVVYAATAWIVVALAPTSGMLPAAIAGLLAALGIGLVNGVLAGATRIHPAIVTLGMATLLRGMITLQMAGKPAFIKDVGFLDSPVLPWIAIGVALLIGILFTTTAERRAAARVKGGQECRGKGFVVTAFPYLLSSLMAGIAGLVQVGRLRGALPMMGSGMEVDLLLIALLGGAPLVTCGVGLGIVNMLGAYIAALAFTIFQNALMLAGLVTTSMQPAIGFGVLFVGATGYLYYSLVARIRQKASPTASESQGPLVTSTSS